MNAGEVNSHPGKALEHHLRNTLMFGETMASIDKLNLDERGRKALLLHDIAKAHPAFQRRLRTGKGRFGHAEPSAGWVLCLTGDLLCAEAVRRHHSRLENVTDMLKFWDRWYGEGGLKGMHEWLWWPGANDIAESLDLEIESWDEANSLSEDCEEILDRMWAMYGGAANLERHWLRLKILFSLLVAADRYEAAVGSMQSRQKLLYSPDVILKFITGMPDDELSSWRNKVREEVAVNARSIIVTSGVYSLTLPTGAGKTLTGMQVAMEAAERLQYNRFIYVLPFISLVEQNAEIARQFYGDVREDHHLAASRSSIANDEYKSDPVGEFVDFFRYWQEPFIVTTLAKLWEVLYSPRANDGMSFHSLARSVVILDEPQAIEAEAWTGFAHTLNLIAEGLNTVFILMTATQPEIASGNELSPYAYLFPRSRHQINWVKERVSIEEAAEMILAEQLRYSSTLMVLNTRKAALKMWLIMNARNMEPYFLSSWVCPRDRRRILEQIIDKEKNGKRRCLVSTQVIEAGIDLDFALVFRDFGPLDCIIQVAGRCNRHCRSKQGLVKVAEVTSPNRSYASMVYDKVLLTQTRNVLNDCNIIDEFDCSLLVKSYYRKVKEAKQASPLWTNIRTGLWGEYQPLYRNYGQDGDMLIVGDEPQTLHDIETLRQGMIDGVDIHEAIRHKRLLFARLAQVSIQVPRRYLEEWSDALGGMIWDGQARSVEEISPGIWVLQDRAIGVVYRPDVGFIPRVLDESFRMTDSGDE